MKIIFMGTPAFAVPILDKIREKHEVILVVTQPDVYNIKKKKFTHSEVKEYALKNDLPLFQPEKIRVDYQKIIDLDVDLIVTAAYGQIVPEEVLNHPKYKAINVHGSILPKYRGGAPIQRAIINGDKETGITIMYMAKKMDAGDIIKISKIPILDTDNQDTVFSKLSILGSEMINDVISDIANNKVTPIKQNEEEVTFAYNLTKEDELTNSLKMFADLEKTIYYKIESNGLIETENENEANIKIVGNKAENKAIIKVLNVGNKKEETIKGVKVV